MCALIIKGCIFTCLVSYAGSLPARNNLDLIRNYVTSNEIQTHEQTREERKYFKKRKRRFKRWGIDVDVSVRFISINTTM